MGHKSEHIHYLDYIRVLASLMVVMIHVSGMYLMKFDTDSAEHLIDGVANSFVRGAVPLFFMISGSLLLRPTYDININKLLSKIASILFIMFFWNFIYALFCVDEYSLYNVFKATYKGHFHMWFFEYLLGVYLLIPIFRIIARNNTGGGGNLLLYSVIVWIIFAICVPTLNAIPFHNEEIRILTSKVNIDIVWFGGYFILGYYLSIFNRKINNLLLVIIFITSVVLHWYVVEHYEMKWHTDSFSIMVLMECVTSFLFVKQSCNIKSNIIRFLSPLTLGVFLIHPLILENIPNIYWITGIKYFLLMYIFILISSLIVTLVIYKIPKVGTFILKI